MTAETALIIPAAILVLIRFIVHLLIPITNNIPTSAKLFSLSSLYFLKRYSSVDAPASVKYTNRALELVVAG
jgi:hypothetical protein